MVNAEISVQEYEKRITNLRKDIAKYEESVNKCNIFDTNVLAERVGVNLNYVIYSDVNSTSGQKREIEILENQFSSDMERLKRCTCVKKMAK
jgi:hypothetical protein